MTEYATGHSVRCNACGVLTHSEDIGCDCDRERECPDCSNTFDPELFPTIRGCFDHEEDRDELREMAAEAHEKVKKLKERVKEAESRARYKEAVIVEAGEDAVEDSRI